MSTYARLTELEAVNQMLSTIDENPISTLAVTGDLNVSVAKQLLNDVSREIQTEGWYFNRESKYPLTKDISGFLNLPVNTLECDIEADNRLKNVVQRGTRLYDKDNFTYTFTENLKVDITLFLTWEELPAAFRQYVAVVSSRRFQRRMLGSDETEKYTAPEELKARAMVVASDTRSRDYNMRDSSMVFNTTRRI
jgi:hypothetical protein